jgi:hypothetical protein
VEASYDPASGMVTLVLSYAEARAAVDAGESLLAAMGPILAGITPPAASRIVSIPPRKRQYAEPAPDAAARREMIAESHRETLARAARRK